MRNSITRWRQIAIVTILFCTLAYTLVFLPQDTLLSLAREDGVMEWAATLLLLTTAILFLILFFQKNSFANSDDVRYFDRIPKRIWFFLLALVFIFMFGEEISWGQRILGFETPEAIKENNMQGEFNFHNHRLLHLFDENDERKSGLALHLTAKRIFIYIFTAFMLFLPLTLKWLPFVRNWVKKLYLPIPVVELGIMFVANVVLYLLFKPFAQHHNKVSRALSEIQELNFAVVLFFLPLVWYGWWTTRQKLRPAKEGYIPPKKASNPIRR